MTQEDFGLSSTELLPGGHDFFLILLKSKLHFSRSSHPHCKVTVAKHLIQCTLNVFDLNEDKRLCFKPTTVAWSLQNTRLIVIVRHRCCWSCTFCPTDSIEANVENAEVHVERGTEQLQRASYYQVSAQPPARVLPSSESPASNPPVLLSSSQQKSRKKMCILAMVCSIVLVIIGIIIWQASK